MSGQLGLEPTPEEYVANLVSVFREVWRVMKDDGILWINLGDSYCGYKGENYGVNPESSNLQKKSAILTSHNIGIPSKSKRMERGSGRWGGGNIPATGNLKPKDLIGIPWMVAFALRADGWYLRSDIIWSKPNPMPESVTDRPTKAHEYLFLLTKSPRYYYDAQAILEPLQEEPHAPGNKPKFGDVKRNDFGTDRMDKVWGNVNGRNKRSVWTINTQPTSYAHFATYPEKLVEPCILAGSRQGDLILDPFSGSGTTGRVAIRHNRQFIGTELNFKYIAEIAPRRLTVQPMIAGVA